MVSLVILWSIVLVVDCCYDSATLEAVANPSCWCGAPYAVEVLAVFLVEEIDVYLL